MFRSETVLRAQQLLWLIYPRHNKKTLLGMKLVPVIVFTLQKMKYLFVLGGFFACK